MFNTIYSIAKNTIIECLREPIYLLMMIAVLVLIGSFPIFSMFCFREQEKLVIDSALATIMLLGWGLSIFVASSALSREIENGTALLLLSKPVNRNVFILGKVFGILASVTLFWVISSMASLIMLRVANDQFRFDGMLMSGYVFALIISFIIGAVFNYVRQSSFSMVSVFSLLITLVLMMIWGQFKYNNETEGTGLSWNVAPALLLVLFALICMATLAAMLSTRFGLVSNLLICVVIFALGLLSDYLIGRSAREPWYDTAPKGTETLWMTHYRFAPTEKYDVGKWDRPVQLDGEGSFTLWSASEEPATLPATLGDLPDKVWEDQQGWVRNPNNVKGKILYLAQYDATDETNRWTILRVGNEQALGKPESKSLEDAYDAYAFRRSIAPPRTPDGGTYLLPVPQGGSYIASALYAVIPNWQLFWMADALAAKQDIPWNYVGAGAIYMLLFATMLVVLAMVVFANREIGKQVIA